jgi:hypothetical protein
MKFPDLLALDYVHCHVLLCSLYQQDPILIKHVSSSFIDVDIWKWVMTIGEVRFVSMCFVLFVFRRIIDRENPECSVLGIGAYLIRTLTIVVFFFRGKRRRLDKYRVMLRLFFRNNIWRFFFSGIHFFYYLYFPFPSLLNGFFLTSGGFIQCPVGGYVETHQLSLYSCIIYESTALMSYHAFLAATLRFSSQCSALFYILVILIDPFLLLPFSNIQQLRC